MYPARSLSISVRVLAGKHLTAPLNVPGDRLRSAGKVNNSANIGKSTDEIVYMWNQDHPDDMSIFAAEPEVQPFQVASSLTLYRTARHPA